MPNLSHIGCPLAGIGSVTLGIGAMKSPGVCLVTTDEPAGVSGWVEGHTLGHKVAICLLVLTHGALLPGTAVTVTVVSNRC